LIGEGKRLFGDGTTPSGLRLVDTKTSSTGVLIATYERAGDVAYGSFAFEEPTEAEVERRQRLTDGWPPRAGWCSRRDRRPWRSEGRGRRRRTARSARLVAEVDHLCVLGVERLARLQIELENDAVAA
jgi:hypothetical protein